MRRLFLFRPERMGLIHAARMEDEHKPATQDAPERHDHPGDEVPGPDQNADVPGPQQVEAAAQQARTFTERRLFKDSTRLRPLLTAVGVELALAVMILISTAVLVGRVPPSTRTKPTVRPAAAALKGR